MKKVAMCGFALALLCVTGCGDSPDKVMKDQISLVNEMCDILDTIKDKESAQKAKPKLEALAKKSKDIEERAKKLKLEDMPKEKQEELQKKYKDDMAKAVGRIMGSMSKLQDKEVQEVLKDVDLGGMMKK